MRVRMLKLAAGPKGAFEVGQVVDVADELARVWIEAEAAEAVEEETKAEAEVKAEIETATLEQPETATQPKRRPKRNKPTKVEVTDA